MSSVNRELYEDGSTRMADADGAFLFRRPRAGVLVVSGSGRDHGQFESLPFDEMEGEALRFGPLDLFVDASQLDFAEQNVVSTWTKWMRQLPTAVQSLTVLHGSEMTGLGVAVAAHLARHSRRIRSQAHRLGFEDGVRAVAPSFAGLDAPLPDRLPWARRTVDGDAVTLEGSTAQFTVRRLGPARILAHIEGFDRGEFAGHPFDEIQRLVTTRSTFALFLDLRRAEGAAGHVAGAWTRWFSSHRHELEAVDVLAGSQSVRLAVAYAQRQSKVDDLIRVHRDAARFDAAVAGAAAPSP